MNSRRMIFLALSLTLLLAANSARATTLHYAGRDFFYGHFPGERVEATVKFSTPLISGSVLSLADINSFTLFAANRTITSDDATFAFAEFTIGPDGLPSDWGLGAELNLEGDSAPEQITTHRGTTFSVFNEVRTFEQDIFFIDDTKPNSSSALGRTEIGSTLAGPVPGIWTLVPEPAAFALAILGCLTHLAVARVSP